MRDYNDPDNILAPSYIAVDETTRIIKLEDSNGDLTPSDASTLGTDYWVNLRMWLEDYPAVYYDRHVAYFIYSCEHATLTPSFTATSSHIVGTRFQDDIVF